MKQYWQFDFYRDGKKKTRFFHGTDSQLQRRIRKYECDYKDLISLSKSRVKYLKTEKRAHIIEL